MSDESPIDGQSKIVVFGATRIRRTWHEDQWFFSVADVVSALTDSADPKQYIKKMRQRDPELNSNWGTICTPPLDLPAPDGKTRKTNCANTEGIFRIIQSISSAKAEPFKRWLAHVGYQRVQEIENPELAQQRMKEPYKEKGHPADWIEKRMRSIVIRDELTDEWKQRGIKEQKDFAILTAEISKATFGLTPAQYVPVHGFVSAQQRGGRLVIEAGVEGVAEESEDASVLLAAGRQHRPDALAPALSA